MSKKRSEIMKTEEGKVVYYKWRRARQGGCCPEWEDFYAFYEWAIESGFSAGLALIRKDRTVPFSPENCEWVDYREKEKRYLAEEWIKEWNKTVNRIRVAYGMEPFEV